jgi:predicted transcriptional regulator
MAGVRQGLVSRLETGHVKHPRFETVLNLARALHMDPAGLRFTAPEGEAA